MSFIIRALGFLLGTALTLLIVLDMVRPQNPWTGRIKGEALRLLWDKQSPLECGGNAVMELRGDLLDLKRGPVFDATGHCRLRLVGVRVKAPRVLVAGGDAIVIVEGGRLEATETAIDASADAVVELRGAAVTGQVRETERARIEGQGRDARPPARPQPDDAERVAPAKDAPPAAPAPTTRRRRPRHGKG